jgi:hypothetical protein
VIRSPDAGACHVTGHRSSKEASKSGLNPHCPRLAHETGRIYPDLAGDCP